MSIDRKRVLVVEDDSLIAFDTGATLEQGLCANVTLSRFDLAKLTSFLNAEPADLMMIDLCSDQHDRLNLVRLALAAGTKVVIGTVCDEDRHGVKGFEQIPVIVKPYDPARLLNLVKNRLCPGDSGPILSAQTHA
jgi:DNA-binding response OmpR family regulator